MDNIDKRVAEAQNMRKLEEVQRNLDTSQLDKSGPDNTNFAQMISDYRWKLNYFLQTFATFDVHLEILTCTKRKSFSMTAISN